MKKPKTKKRKSDRIDMFSILFDSLKVLHANEEPNSDGTYPRKEYSEEEIMSAVDVALKIAIVSEVMSEEEESIFPTSEHRKDEEIADEFGFNRMEHELTRQDIIKSGEKKDGKLDSELLTKPFKISSLGSLLPFSLHPTISKDSHRVLNAEERGIFSKEALSEFYQLRALGILQNTMAELIIEKATYLGPGGFNKKDLQLIVGMIFNKEQRRKFNNNNRIVTFVRNDTVH